MKKINKRKSTSINDVILISILRDFRLLSCIDLSLKLLRLIWTLISMIYADYIYYLSGLWQILRFKDYLGIE